MIDLPENPAPANLTPGLLYFGSSIVPALGGPSQDIERLGTRYKLKVTMPPMANDGPGNDYLSALRQGKTRGVRMPWPLGGFVPVFPGDPKIVGAGQTGSNLLVTGFVEDYTIQRGQFFSIETDGEHYLYEASETLTTVERFGEFSLPIFPMIRAFHQDQDAIHILKPMIQGRLQGQDLDWDLDTAYLNSFSFEIHERK